MTLETPPLGPVLEPVIATLKDIALGHRQRSETIYRLLSAIVSELETLVEDEQLGLIGLPPEWWTDNDC